MVTPGSMTAAWNKGLELTGRSISWCPLYIRLGIMGNVVLGTICFGGLCVNLNVFKRCFVCVCLSVFSLWLYDKCDFYFVYLSLCIDVFLSFPLLSLM